MERFREILRRENRKYNLISRMSFDETFKFLWTLSSQILAALEPFSSLVDIGSGAGFPGLAIKILSPEKRLLLVEPGTKRALFLKRTILELGLEEINVFKGDFPLFHKKFCNGEFDYLSSMGIKKKGSFIREDCGYIRKGFCFVTGEKETSRLLLLRKIKKYNSNVVKVYGKDKLFLVIIRKDGKNNSNS